MANERYQNVGDADLLRMWIAGNRRSGKVLYRRYFPVLYRFLRSKVPEAIDDIMQRTWETVLRKGDDYAGGSFRAYLLAIARHTMLHYFRKQSRSPLVFDSEEVSCEDMAPGPFKMVAANEHQRLLVKALRRIPLDFQILIELNYWEEMNAREIGEVLGVPHSTIRDRKGKAKKLLRLELEKILRGDGMVNTALMGLETWAEEIKLRLAASAETRVDEGDDVREPADIDENDGAGDVDAVEAEKVDRSGSTDDAHAGDGAGEQGADEDLQRSKPESRSDST